MVFALVPMLPYTTAGMPMHARTALLGINALTAVWLGLIMPLLCAPGWTSDHDHGLHLIFDVPQAPAHAHQHPRGHSSRSPGQPRLPDSAPPARLAMTEPWSNNPPPHVHASDVGASLPAAALVAIPVPDVRDRDGRSLQRSSVNLPPPWHPPQSV